MARSYTNVTTSIWNDEEFCALSAGAQRTYFMLITQTEVTAVGTLALTLRRWARTCSENDLEIWLAELSDARFVLIDEEHEELLVRTFVKWDGGYKHAQRAKAVIATAKAIRSHSLRKAAAYELSKLGVDLDIDRDPSPTPEPPDRDPSGTRQAPPSGRSVVTEVGYESTPHSTNHKREPAPSETDVAPSPFCSKHAAGTEQPCRACATARTAYEQWLLRQTDLSRRRKASDRSARAGCCECDEDGWLIDANGSPTAAKCSHAQWRAASRPGDDTEATA